MFEGFAISFVRSRPSPPVARLALDAFSKHSTAAERRPRIATCSESVIALNRPAVIFSNAIWMAASTTKANWREVERDGQGQGREREIKELDG
jgi:hypothetical protein